MPYHYQVYKRLIFEVQNRVPSLKFFEEGDRTDQNPDEGKISVLDYGAGLGSGLWAAMHCYSHDNIQRIAAVEPNINMRKLGKFLSEDLNY